MQQQNSLNVFEVILLWYFHFRILFPFLLSFSLSFPIKSLWYDKRKYFYFSKSFVSLLESWENHESKLREKNVVVKHCLTFHYVKQSKCNVQISLQWLSLNAFVVFIFLVIVIVLSTKIKIWLVNQHKNQKKTVFLFFCCVLNYFLFGVSRPWNGYVYLNLKNIIIVQHIIVHYHLFSHWTKIVYFQ